MLRPHSAALATLLLALAAGCGQSIDDSGSPDNSDNSDSSDDGSFAPDAGGGGVSFGGAQDIGELRGILDRGEVPGPSTLDANGFFNEHYNAPPATPCADRLCLTAGVAVGPSWLSGGYQAALQLAVSTNVNAADYPRLPMNLVVVVDHSGSMASDGRLVKVKAGLGSLIDALHDDDRLAILTFDDTVTSNAPFTPELDRAHLHAVVDAIAPAGGTNLFDGLQAGFRLLGDAPPSERQNRVIFLSDGLATVGDVDPDHIIAMAAGHIQHGIGLTTIGVGTDFDVELMRGLAERGAGNFYYVENAAAATEVFTEELDYFLSPIALDVRVEAEAASGWSFTDVVGSSLWTQSARTGSMSIPAVFLSSRISQAPGETGGRRGGGSMIFIGLTPLTSVAGRVADLTLSYRLPNSPERTSTTVRLDYSANPTETPAEPHLSYPQLAERYAMYNMYLGLRAATEQAVDNYACATAALVTTGARARDWRNTHEEDQDLSADIELYEQFIANLRAAGAPDPVTTSVTCHFDGAGNPAGEGSGSGSGSGGGTCGVDYDCDSDDDYYEDDYRNGGCSGPPHCSTTGRTPAAPVGFVIVLGAALRRRRRR